MVPLIVVYVIGIPGTALFLLVRYRRSKYDEWFMKNFGGLVLPYRIQYEWFEILNMTMKTIFILLLEFYSLFRTYNVQVFAALVLLFLALVSQYFFTPYQIPYNNALSFVWILIGIFCLFTGVVFSSASVEQWEKDYFAFLVYVMFFGGLLASAYFGFRESLLQQKFGVKKQRKETFGKTFERGKHKIEVDEDRFQLLRRIFPETHARIRDHVSLLPPATESRFYEDCQHLDDDIEIRQIMTQPVLNPLFVSSEQSKSADAFMQTRVKSDDDRWVMTENPSFSPRSESFSAMMDATHLLNFKRSSIVRAILETEKEEKKCQEE